MLPIVDGVLFSDFSAVDGPSYGPASISLGSMLVLQLAADLLRVGATSIAAVTSLLFLLP